MDRTERRLDLRRRPFIAKNHRDLGEAHLKGGFGALLDQVVAAITSERDRWVRMMLRYEYGLPAAVRSPWQAAGSTFSAFLLCGPCASSASKK